MNFMNCDLFDFDIDFDYCIYVWIPHVQLDLPGRFDFIDWIGFFLTRLDLT